MKLKLTALFLIVVGLSVYAYPKSHGHHFMTPSKSTCLRYGGRWGRHFDVCQASWPKANKICRASRGRLPNLNELKRVVRSCGGVPRRLGHIGDEKTHYTDSLCYKRLGIKYVGDGAYWTSTSINESGLVRKVNMEIQTGHYGVYESIGCYITCIK